jgi:PST family polysaccharide transporter
MGGVAWSGGTRAVRVVLQLATSVVLARLLTPEEFGLIAMITVLTNFVGVFSEFGLAAALIQRSDLREGHRSSTFWLTLAVGVLLGAGVYAAAPWISAFYDEDRLVPLTHFIAVSFLVASLRVVQAALLNREMRFRAIGSIEIAATLVGGGVGIAMALAGYGVWSLVAQLLAIGVAEAVGFWVASGWRPRLQFDTAAVRELMPYSLNFMGFSVVNYWVRNADNLLIGRFVGSVGLGIYDRAYRTMLLPLTHGSGLMSRVMFPALSRIQTDRGAVKRLYVRAIRSISLVTFPLMIGLLVAADVFVATLFGPKWAEVVPVLRVLCLVGLLQSVSSTTGWLYQSQGKTDVLLRWGLFSGAVTVVAFGIGVHWGFMGVAVAYVIRTVLLTPLSFAIPGRFVGLRLGEVTSALAGTLACASAMGAAIALARTALPTGFPVQASLALQIVGGIACYAAIVIAVRLEAYRDTLRAVQNYWSSRSSA